MRQQLRELAVVREDQKSLCFQIETTDREDARCRRHEVEHRCPSLRIASRGDVARGLVQQPMHDRGIDDDRNPIDCDAIAARVDTPAELRGDTVDFYPTGRDQLFTLATRTE